MRVLILNWRDVRHPRAGGAEVLTHEVARRLVEQGNEVEWFTASAPGIPAEEDIDGVRVVRAGQQWSVHVSAFRRYRSVARDHFDVVLDEVNTIPFFTPLWAGIPVVMLICQLAREVWWYESRFPLSLAGWLAEPAYLRLYRDVPAITIAESGVQDLRQLGFRGQITIAPVGIEPIEAPRERREQAPTYVYVGRLAPSKRVDHIIRAFSLLHGRCRTARLWLIGDGSDRGRLEALARRLDLSEAVEFCGRVSPEEKHSRLARAHALVMASAREGWGLVVTEANACGTPAIVYDVPGLRDSVRADRTGLVVAPRPADMAAAMERIVSDPDLHRRLAEEGRTWSRTFTFDATTEAVGAQLRRAARR